jgi:YgiT-type zinc finger domain-containing protein
MDKSFIFTESKMKNSNHANLCPICGGSKAPGTTTYSVDLGTGVVVVRNVQAQICLQCGEEWIDHATAQKLETIVEEARAKQRQIEVLAF